VDDPIAGAALVLGEKEKVSDKNKSVEIKTKKRFLVVLAFFILLANCLSLLILNNSIKTHS
jgi:hypothetical protein